MITRIKKWYGGEYKLYENDPYSPLVILALQLLYRKSSESMGNHDSEIVDAGSVD